MKYKKYIYLNRLTLVSSWNGNCVYYSKKIPKKKIFFQTFWKLKIYFHTKSFLCLFTFIEWSSTVSMSKEASYMHATTSRSGRLWTFSFEHWKEIYFQWYTFTYTHSNTYTHTHSWYSDEHLCQSLQINQSTR